MGLEGEHRIKTNKQREARHSHVPAHSKSFQSLNWLALHVLGFAFPDATNHKKFLLLPSQLPVRERESESKTETERDRERERERKEREVVYYSNTDSVYLWISIIVNKLRKIHFLLTITFSKISLGTEISVKVIKNINFQEKSVLNHSCTFSSG